jgi:cytochrome c-type biogenesis protein CcmH/NrfF
MPNLICVVAAASPRMAPVRLGFTTLALLLALSPVALRAATQQEIEESLTCQCGCGLTVHSCNHLQCPSGEPMKKEIADRLARGEDRETILAAFRQRYGEKVLSSPTFRGFNWLAWITPFAVVLAGAFGVTLVIRRWVRAPTPPVPPVAPGAPGDEDLRRRLARELDELDRDA